MKLRNIANKETGNVRRYCTFVERMNTILNFSTTLGKEYNEKFVATRILHTVKDMMGSKGAENIDDKKSTVLPCGFKEQASFKEEVSSEWMRNEKISMDYRHKKLELQLRSLSAYLIAFMISKDY